MVARFLHGGVERQDGTQGFGFGFGFGCLERIDNTSQGVSNVP
jgi:hypothetical protein